MGWAHGVNAEGREVGYSVEAKCDRHGCVTKIDRGLGYACGGMHDGGDHGCGGYFCARHLYFSDRAGVYARLCKKCKKAEDAIIEVVE